jgi:hypothetical protein
VKCATGIPTGNVLPFCSHTHAGPVILEYYRGEGEDCVHAYAASLPHLAAGAVRRALESLAPVHIAAGTGASDIAVNRDLKLPDGRIIVGCNPEGFADTSVGVMRIDREDGAPLACIVNYACHSTVLGPGNRLISPDYPGSTREVVEKNTGATCVFLQGAAGDMGPVETFVPDAKVARNLGARLGLEAARVHLGLEPRPTRKRLRNVVASGAALADYEHVPLDVPPPALRFLAEPVELPLRSRFSAAYEDAPAQLEEAKRALAVLEQSHATAPDLAAAFQRIVRLQLRAERMVAYRGVRTKRVETFAIRLGESAIVAISSEPYCRIGVDVKASSPFEGRTLFAGYVGGDMMYLPTAEAFANDPPSMQVDNSFYTSEAADIATEHLIGLLNRLNAPGSAPQA